MKPEIKTKWIAALRSGEYKQGKMFLKHADEYCCLGVLCDLHCKETGMQWESDGSYCGELKVLPDEVRAWAGLEDVNPKLGDFVAAYWNDMMGDFPKIAGLIEQRL